MAGAAALDSLPHLRTHYSSYDISPHSRSSWPRVNSSLAFQANVNKERLKDSGFPASAPPQAFLESPVRDGLRTPLANNMNSTVFQPQQYRSYGGKQDAIYPSTASYASSTAGQQQPFSTTNYSSRTSATSVVSNLCGMSVQPYLKAHSPQNASTGVPILAEENLRWKSGILPSLQIPTSINNSGGSLGEFAAQVRDISFFDNSIPNFQARLPVFFGSSL
jgi:hypothetical protein